MDYRRLRGKIKHATERQRKAAENLKSGMPILHALVEAGYSDATARLGTVGIPRVVMALMNQEKSNFVELGRALDPGTQENLVRGMLAYNVIKREDKGVNSAYRLGQDRRVNMFVPENQTGIIVLESPKGNQIVGELEEEKKVEKKARKK